jgi:hypothetical protein
VSHLSLLCSHAWDFKHVLSFRESEWELYGRRQYQSHIRELNDRHKFMKDYGISLLLFFPFIWLIQGLLLSMKIVFAAEKNVSKGK